MHSNCSGNLQGNCGMAFGRVCSSSFEGSPLSLLACFCFRPYIWLIRSENSKTGWSQGLRWMLPCVEVDSGIISFGKIERTSTVVSIFLFLSRKTPVQFHPKRYMWSTDLKNWLIPEFAGMLPCVEVDKGIHQWFRETPVKFHPKRCEHT